MKEQAFYEKTHISFTRDQKFWQVEKKLHKNAQTR